MCTFAQLRTGLRLITKLKTKAGSQFGRLHGQQQRQPSQEQSATDRSQWLHCRPVHCVYDRHISVLTLCGVGGRQISVLTLWATDRSRYWHCVGDRQILVLTLCGRQTDLGIYTLHSVGDRQISVVTLCALCGFRGDKDKIFKVTNTRLRLLFGKAGSNSEHYLASFVKPRILGANSSLIICRLAGIRCTYRTLVKSQ